MHGDEMSEWNQMTLGSIATKDGYGLVDGPFGSNLPASCYTEEGIPVIRGSNLSLGINRFRADEFVFVSQETAKRLARSLCRPFDIVFTKKGTLGQTGLIPNSGPYSLYLLSSNQMKLTLDTRLADPLFVYYSVSSPESVRKIIQDSEATGVPKTNIAYLRDFPIMLPPLPIQHAIAHILGSLDDKIELNRRMNETLEAMARALFKDWFVEFGPVRAKMEGRQPPGLSAEIAALFPDALDTEGKPVGWVSGSLADIAQSRNSGVLPSEVLADTPYIGLEHMPRRSIALSSWGGADKVTSNKSRFSKGDILFGKLRPYFHKVGIAALDGICSTDIIVLGPKNTSWMAYLLLCVSSDEFVAYTDQTSDGTKMPRTSWSVMKKYPLPLPDKGLAAVFNEFVRPMFATISANIHESRTLSSLRDLLLPKLLSGELRVRDAEGVITGAR